MDDWKFEPARDHGLSQPERSRSLRRESGLTQTCTHMLWSAGVRTYLRLYHRMRISGREHLPTQPPFILVANHASHLDALVMATAVPFRMTDALFPIAAGDVFFETAPMAMFAASMINALPMWRKNCGPHALKELRERLVGQPCSYILFPEGARARTDDMKPFKAGIGMIVAGTSVPVVPCYLEGCLAAMPPDRVVPRPRKITMRIGPALEFSTVTDDRAGWQEIATRLHAAVTELRQGPSAMKGA